MPKFLLSFVLLFFVFSSSSFATECSSSCGGIDECQQKIDECTKLLQISASATKPHEEKARELVTNINALEGNIASLEKQITKKEADIIDRSKKLEVQSKILDSQIRDYYKKDYQSPLEYFLITVFNSSNINATARILGYRQTLINNQKKFIGSLVTDITDLNFAKKKLEENKTWIAAKKADLEITLAPIKKLVDEAKAYQSKLSQTVGTLSARQQQLIAERLGSLNLSRSAGISMACSDDRKIDPGFSPAFAFYTFGIPHRVGMNQFGAYGRAVYDHQDYDKILRAYYNFDDYKSFDQNTQIKVNDSNDVNKGNVIWTGSLEDYIKRIYEVPSSWPSDTLKAQAIAARSYVLAITNNGQNSVCATQNCQVFQANPKSGAWEQAVNDTAGKVMTQGGQPIKAWFSSTDGGYTLTSSEYGWSSTSWTKHVRDTSGDINGIGDLLSKAYDRDSPCFYNAQGWRAQYNKSAWLKSEEVADIVNVIMVSAFTNDWDTWDQDRVKNELRNHGATPFDRIENVSMSFDLGTGKTTSVTISDGSNSKTFDATTFKNYFNVRAPANIAIVGPLFNIEKK